MPRRVSATRWTPPGTSVGSVRDVRRIEPPSKVKNSLPSGAFGQLATGIVAGLGNTVGVTPDDLRLGVPVTNSHRKAERAVADNKKVVVFFQNPRALDDQTVADSVRSLHRRMKKVVVLTDDVRNADRYGTLLEDLQVSQAPAIVVIGRSGKAELIEEERRLLYVAMTRARNELTCVIPLRFQITSQPKTSDGHVYGGRSRFLTEKVIKCFDEQTFQGSNVDVKIDETAAADSGTIDVASRLKQMW